MTELVLEVPVALSERDLLGSRRRPGPRRRITLAGWDSRAELYLRRHQRRQAALDQAAADPAFENLVLTVLVAV